MVANGGAQQEASVVDDEESLFLECLRLYHLEHYYPAFAKVHMTRVRRSVASSVDCPDRIADVHAVGARR
jgi:hypothetical protein